MKTEGRNEWNALPGYTKAERLQGTALSTEAAIRKLEVPGLTPEALAEFLKEPTLAISKKIGQFVSDSQGDLTKLPDWLEKHPDFLTLVERMVPVIVFAERERQERETELARARRG